MDVDHPGLDDEINKILEELIVLQRRLAKTRDNTGKVAGYEDDVKELLKDLKFLETEVVRYRAPTHSSSRIDEREPNFKLQLEVLDKAQELLSAVEILNDLSSSTEERESNMRLAKKTIFHVLNRLQHSAFHPVRDLCFLYYIIPLLQPLYMRH